MIKHAFRGMLAGIAVSALLVTNVAFSQEQSAPKQPKTMKEMIATCAVATIGGAVIGRFLDKGNRTHGTAAGAALGAGVCAAVMAFNNKEDKKRIAEAEARAAETGQTQQDAWADDQGKNKGLTSQVIGGDQTAKIADVPTICRTVETDLSAGGSKADPIQQTYCRAPDGSWKTKTDLGIA